MLQNYMRLLLNENLPKGNYSFCIDSFDKSTSGTYQIDFKNKRIFKQG